MPSVASLGRSVAAEPVLSVIALLRLPELLARHATLLDLGLRALDIYAAAKRRDRVVDFQDLEYLALRLLIQAREPGAGG